MGPLGNGFTIDESQKRVAIVGGGIGIYPLHYLAKKHPAVDKHVFNGCLCKEKAVLGDRFEQMGCDLTISTDDGSMGYCGYVTDIFEKAYNPEKFDITFTCGPLAMAEKTVKLVRKAGGRCQVSLEERMGCGIGACLVCTCEIMEEGGTTRKTVCKDGPVFNEKQVFPEV
jgi:dihydroorotate dehydrogenase electron transfer subunit